MAGEVVHDDDVAGPQFRDEHLGDIGLEGVPIDGAIEHPGSDEAAEGHRATAGMGLTNVGRLLGHADVKTTDRYSHFDAEPMRRAAETIGSTLAAALGSDCEAQSNVVVLNK